MFLRIRAFVREWFWPVIFAILLAIPMYGPRIMHEMSKHKTTQQHEACSKCCE